MQKAKRRTNTEDVRISFYHSYRRRECGTKADRVSNKWKRLRVTNGRVKIEDKEEALGYEARPKVTSGYRQ